MYFFRILGALWDLQQIFSKRGLLLQKHAPHFLSCLHDILSPTRPPQKNFAKDRKKTQHVCVIFRKQPVTSSLHIKGSMCYTYRIHYISECLPLFWDQWTTESNLPNTEASVRFSRIQKYRTESFEHFWAICGSFLGFFSL